MERIQDGRTAAVIASSASERTTSAAARGVFGHALAVPSIVLVLRIVIGGVLIVAGAMKAGHADALASTIAAFRLLPSAVIAPMALLLPYFEIGLGGYLVVGLFTRAAALIAAIEFTVFAVAIASVVARGIPAACGCFGPGDTAPATWLDVVRDLALAALTLPIILRSPGLLALDTRIAAAPASDDSNGAS